MAWTFALVALVRPVLHRVLCSNETIPNAPKTLRKAPKHEFRVQWHGSGSVVAKNLGDFVARTFALICCTEFRAVTKQYQMHSSITKCTKIWVSSPMVQLSCECFEKFLRGTKFCINCTSSAILHRLLWCNKTVPYAPKLYKTHKNKSLGSNGVDRVCSLPKILMRLHGMNK